MILWIGRGAFYVTVAMGVYLLFNWETATAIDWGATAVFLLITVVAKDFNRHR